MEISSIPALIARQIVFWKKPRLTISEDIFTSKRLYDIFPQKKAKKQINLIKKYYPQATQILTQTLAQKKELVGMFNRNVTVSPNWLPLDFPPQKLTPFSLRTTDILFIGRIETQKNLPKFIDIVENLVSAFPNLKVKIVGSGSQTKSIIKIIKSNNLSANITVLPPTINPQKYYLDSKIFLLTSDYEGFPLTLTEAVSCGCFPICHTLPEIKPFFDKHSVQILFQKNSEAVHLIKNVLSSTPSTEVFHHYQNKLIKLQSKNISQYINYCLS